MSISFDIAAPYRDLFRDSCLDSYEALMNGNVGEKISSLQDRRRLYRFDLPGPGGQSHRFYLKRMAGEPALLLLKALAGGHRPHCGPIRELQLLTALSRRGFAVMQPVAWGEEMRFGFPSGGFLVVAEVRGRELAALSESLQGDQKAELLRETGQLIGALHAAGFFQPVRLKDLIREESTQKLVMIDRETGKPWAVGFSVHRAIVALARTARRTLRDGHRFGPATSRSFLAGYAAGVSGKWSVSVAELRRAIVARLRKDLE